MVLPWVWLEFTQLSQNRWPKLTPSQICFKSGWLYNPHFQQILDEATDPWGVVVERVEVKDVRLPQNLQRAMAAEAEAHRDAKAKVRNWKRGR